MPAPKATPSRTFLLSPANCGGERARILMRDEATFHLAVRLRAGEATLGETFAFLSGLYFRGKLAYARVFARPPKGSHGVYVITTCCGLVSPDKRVTLAELREMACVPIDLADTRYRAPLERDVKRLSETIGPAGEVVLLGSIATGKYVDILSAALGGRLRFPSEFVGRGDMSRGGLMLRHVTSGQELRYIPLGAQSSRKGKRPPKLVPIRRAKSARVKRVKRVKRG
jgi:hypothetical protein